jgi:hypothetical protein
MVAATWRPSSGLILMSGQFNMGFSENFDALKVPPLKADAVAVMQSKDR